jgi:hypothetical protein
MNAPLDAASPLVPERISELTASCVRFVHASVGAELDLTHETLPILDHYIRLSRVELATRPEAADLIAQAAGTYFGQVLAIEYGGLWRVNTPDVHTWRLYFQPFFLALNPIGVAYEMLFQSDHHSGPSSAPLFARDEAPLVEARLAALPEVDEDEYFTFSMRYDVLQLAIETLRAAQADADLEDVTYEWGDYEDELDRLGTSAH